MSVRAVSNQPGSYSEYEKRADTYFGNGTPEVYEYNQLVATSYKADTVKGNGVNPFPYSRSIYRISEDHPETRVNTIYDGSNIYQRTGYSTYLSKGKHPEVGYLDVSDLADNAAKAANVKALNKLGGDKQQALVDLMESRQTFNMLRDSALKLYDALRLLKGRKPINALNRLGLDGRSLLSGKTLADGWLEYKYGWKPLVDSVYGYQEALKDDWAVNRVLNARGTQRFDYSKTVSDGEGGSHEYFGYGGYTTHYRATVKRPALGELNAIGALNPVSVAWEIIPYSFVVDWFVPVGDVLEAYSAVAGLENITGYTSHWHHTTHRYKTSNNSQRNGDRQLDIEGGVFNQEAFYHTRKVHGWNPPEFYGDPEPFGGMKLSRGASAAALIRQLLR